MKTRCWFLVAMVLCGGGPGAAAATRSSADYSITTDTTDAGGRWAGSADYVHYGSLGGLSGLSSLPTPPQVLKHGYLGQLYDVSGVALGATPPTVNEGAARQVYANAVTDDSSVFGLPGSSVVWSVVSGPVAGLGASGTVTAGLVYQDSPATIRGDYQGRFGTLTLTVLDVNPDNYGLYARDGLPDTWQASHFGDNNPDGAPGLDPDGDGQTNAFEYVVGTVPTDANSCLRLRIEPVPGHPDWKNVVFGPYFRDRTYTVLCRFLLDDGTFLPLTGSKVGDLGRERYVTDLNATNPARFYRVQVTLP